MVLTLGYSKMRSPMMTARTASEKHEIPTWKPVLPLIAQPLLYIGRHASRVYYGQYWLLLFRWRCCQPRCLGSYLATESEASQTCLLLMQVITKTSTVTATMFSSIILRPDWSSPPLSSQRWLPC